MELKKSNQANLEAKRPIFFQIGIVLALSTCLVAFEWTGKSENKLASLDDDGAYIEDVEEVVITRMEQPEPEPVIPPETPTEFEEVENDEVVPDIVRQDSHVDEDDEIPYEPEGFPAEALEPDPVPPYMATVQPSFRGGDINEFRKYVQGQLNYPQHLVEMGIEGKVYVKFVVDSKGNMKNIQVVRSVDDGLSKEVMRVMRATPGDWKPGEQGIYKVPVEFIIPVDFKLQHN